MNKKFISSFLFPLLCFCFSLQATIYVGISKTDITPPIGTPSAGYTKRTEQVMQGTHDPLYATAMIIDNSEKIIAFCAVDNFGFNYEICQEIIKKVHSHPELSNCEVYIGSSHTHSGGGAFWKYPVLAALVGRYNPVVTQFYIDTTAKAIIDAWGHKQLAKIGIGYGEVQNISKYRSTWPEGIKPLTDTTLIKVVSLDNIPIALLYNFPIHPCILDFDNLLFSADLVGYARDQLKKRFGDKFESLYFNGAQGDINPNVTKGGDRFALCNLIGTALAESVANTWDNIETKEEIDVATLKHPYTLIPQPSTVGMTIPVEKYETEINMLVLDQKHAFVTVPGELSCIYDRTFKKRAQELGYAHLSVLGLVNDAHGYMILPEAWRHKTYESSVSFGGENYGIEVEAKIMQLLEACMQSIPQ